MSEHLICPICDANVHSRFKENKEIICFWCEHKFTWSDRLKAMKTRLQMTTNQLANECRINARTFQGLVAGRFEPSKINLEKINKVFKRHL